MIGRHKQALHYRVEVGSMLWFITTVYGHPVEKSQRLLWKFLSSLSLNILGFRLVSGDFNEIFNVSAKVGGAPFNLLLIDFMMCWMLVVF